LVVSITCDTSCGARRNSSLTAAAMSNLHRSVP
jgi:hypothetical protein